MTNTNVRGSQKFVNHITQVSTVSGGSQVIRQGKARQVNSVQGVKESYNKSAEKTMVISNHQRNQT